MANALIVDDEVLIVQLLVENVDWSSAGIERVFKAHNAVMARKIIEEETIDVLVCDIEMPQEDGLHLIEWTREQSPETINIILTAFPDFNYARKAIQLGVFRYLLKPVSFDELELALESAVKEAKSRGKNRNLSEEESTNEALNSSVVGQARQFIQDHYTETISRQDIEMAVHMNGDYLNRIFKKETGYSLIQYIQYYRVLAAKQMITKGRTNLADVAFSAGFDNPSYFIKVFRKWTGMTPGEYELTIKKGQAIQGKV